MTEYYRCDAVWSHRLDLITFTSIYQMGVVSVGASLWILAGLQSPRTVQIIISCLGLIIVAKYNTGEISSSWYFKYFGSQHLWQGQNPNLSVIQVDRNTDTHWLNQTMNNAEIIFKYLNVSQSLLLIILATWILRWSWRPVTSWLIQTKSRQPTPSIRLLKSVT